MEESRRKRRELKSEILEKFGEVVSAIREAKYVNQVICILHSIAVQPFPIDSSRLTGCVDSRFRNQLLSGRISSPFERDEWWDVFYHGAAFSTLAMVLLYNEESLKNFTDKVEKVLEESTAYVAMEGNEETVFVDELPTNDCRR
ncbi:uncharacterized protein LOC122650242 [Telopea speciosissima]|uniref:uncharacterized protein LOC122650242 n=1 Tax=Telopea speciosissima TaxID=54955 RepID=UPI001CC5E6E5|nr:uncharacterized protein LOC122650242 [Telopea speciosissima]